MIRLTSCLIVISSLTFIFGLSFYCSAQSVREREQIGIYVGSFDPPHAGHRAMVLRSLESAHVSRVLIVPNDLTPHKPFRSRTQDRLQMLRIMFGDDPRVIVPDIEWGFPLLKSSLLHLESEVSRETIRNRETTRGFDRVFIAGDDVYESRIHAWLTEINISPDSWIIFPRHHETPTESLFRGRPIQFIQRTDFEKSLSSSQLRSQIQNNDISSRQMIEAFGPELAHWILDKRIYSEPADLDSKLRICKEGLASLRNRLFSRRIDNPIF